MTTRGLDLKRAKKVKKLAEPQNVETPQESLKFMEIQTQVSFLQGKVLTVIEASLPEGRQLEAVKGLVKGQFRDQLDYIARLCFSELPMYSQSELESQGIDVEDVVKNSELLED